MRMSAPRACSVACARTSRRRGWLAGNGTRLCRNRARGDGLSLAEILRRPMEHPSWYPDEVAHAGGEHLDADYVPRYDQKAATDPADDLALLRTLGLNATHTLVDLGTGTGTFARAAAPLCRRVVAVDVSPVMLATLRQKAAQLGIANIECAQRGFLSYEHQGDLADF